MTLARWSDEATTPHELRAARLMAAARLLPVPSPPPFAALEVRALAPRAPRVVTLKLVTGMLLLLAAMLVVVGWRLAPTNASNAVFPSVGAVRVSAPRALESPPSPVADVQPEPAKPPPPTIRRPAPNARAVDTPVLIEPAPEARRSTLGEEAALIASALQALRSENDASRAVAVLLEYHSRFPDGVLRPEALLAQAQAERARRHPESALELLAEASPLANEKLRGELELTRGELFAELEQCERAEVAFGSALETVTGALAERAAWGRARCCARRLAPEARPRLQAFLDAYPQSVHAEEAREFLETMPFVRTPR